MSPRKPTKVQPGMTDEQTPPPQPEPGVEEPSVLEYLKSLLTPWKGERITLPPAAPKEGPPPLEEPPRPAASPDPLSDAASPTSSPAPAPPPEPLPPIQTWPWRSLAALALALVAQIGFEPPERSPTPGAWLYLAGAALAVWAFWAGEWRLPALPRTERSPDNGRVRRNALLLALPLIVLAYLNLGNNTFTPFNVFLWLAALGATLWALWLPGPPASAAPAPWWARLEAFFRRPSWNVQITRWHLTVAAVLVFVGFFLTYHLQTVAPEMNSDHAEKLLDVGDILQGKYAIFFPRNTGREPLYAYLSAWVAQNLGTGISFLTLKISAVVGLALTLPYIYLLGRDIANRRVGLLAVVFTGMGYWPVVFTRFALRISFYPLFVAPTLFYFMRGLRRSSRNDFLLSGLFLGLGLLGYTPFRIMPLILVVLLGVYLLHGHAVRVRTQTFWAFALLAVVALLAAMPILHYAMDNPEGFAFRAFSRVGTAERPLPGAVTIIFAHNLWRALAMFAWNDGNIWVHSIPGRPALDVVSAALFYLGMALLLARYARKRHWIDLFLLLTVPLLMMPSILSLAFPDENPALNRAAGAIVPVFLIVAFALDGLLAALRRGLGNSWGPRAAAAVGAALIFWSASHNFDLIFRQYYLVYRQSSWNTSELGAMVGSFTRAVGNPDSAYVVPFPHWVDTRLVGMVAGYATKDYALPRERLAETVSIPGPKLFLVNPNDAETLLLLEQLFPEGNLEVFHSQAQFKDFLMYFVLPPNAAPVQPLPPATPAPPPEPPTPELVPPYPM